MNGVFQAWYFALHDGHRSSGPVSPVPRASCYCPTYISGSSDNQYQVLFLSCDSHLSLVPFRVKKQFLERAYKRLPFTKVAHFSMSHIVQLPPPLILTIAQFLQPCPDRKETRGGSLVLMMHRCLSPALCTLMDDLCILL
jgi:hypothetical protein